MGAILALFQAGGFIARNWDKLLVAAVVGLWSAGCYWAGGWPYKAKLEKFQSEVEVARAQQKIEDAADEAASIEFVNNLDREHEKTLETYGAAWAAEYDRLRGQAAGAKRPAQPIQPAPTVCADASGNQRLSAALEEYRAEARAALDDLRAADAGSREETAKLLAVCHKQALSLTEVVRWGEHEQQLWGQDGQQVRLR